MKQVKEIAGPTDIVQQLNEIGLYVGQNVQLITQHIWRINNSFVLAIRIPDSIKIILG